MGFPQKGVSHGRVSALLRIGITRQECVRQKVGATKTMGLDRTVHISRSAGGRKPKELERSLLMEQVQESRESALPRNNRLAREGDATNRNAKKLEVQLGDEQPSWGGRKQTEVGLPKRCGRGSCLQSRNDFSRNLAPEDRECVPGGTRESLRDHRTRIHEIDS